MKISIKSDDLKLTLRLPTGLILNRLTAGIVCRKLKKEGIHLTRKQTVLFIKKLKKYTHNSSMWGWNIMGKPRKPVFSTAVMVSSFFSNTCFISMPLSDDVLIFIGFLRFIS